MNKITITGNLGKDAEVRTTTSGKKVCAFSVASTKSFKRGDQWEKSTTWFNVSLWGDKAERFAQALKKGVRVHLEGELRQNKFTDKSGEERSNYEVVAERVYLVSSPGERDQDHAEEE
jgi:single-strand DNA-binding protein